MKVGTDGVLLGAWTNLEHRPNSILDVGAGTGVIALQLAQRSSAELIDALEVDENAFEQCVFNFEESPWGDRLFCYHAGFLEFAQEMDEEYDLIVSNPPFYDTEYHSDNPARNQARFAQSLPFEILLNGVLKLLSKRGIFSLILPKRTEENVVQTAHKLGLHLQKRTEVRGNKDAPIKRSLLQFGFQKTTFQSDVLTIEKARHDYTEKYINLTKEFYLKM